MMRDISKIAGKTRIYRKIHGWISIVFVFFLVVVGITAILLAWKKELNLIPATQSSLSENKTEWIGIGEMARISQEFMQDSLGKSNDIDRIDIRLEKGIAKILFKNHFTEIQLDGFTGSVLSVKQRNSDLIEKIHDGSIFDFLFSWDSEISKLVYSTVTSLILLFLSFTGFYLWYNPRKMKKIKQKPEL